MEFQLCSSVNLEGGGGDQFLSETPTEDFYLPSSLNFVQIFSRKQEPEVPRCNVILSDLTDPNETYTFD
jgi:hypothetical protein